MDFYTHFFVEHNSSQLLAEMPFSRSDYIERTMPLIRNITEHLYKTLKWQDPQNNVHHIQEIDNWFQELDDLKGAWKRGRFTEKEFYDSLYDGIIGTENYHKFYKKHKDAYSGYTVKYTDNQIADIIHSIMKIKAKELGDHKLSTGKNGSLDKMLSGFLN